MENKKWTKKYLLIIWLITLVVVVVAIFGHTYSFFKFSWFGTKVNLGDAKEQTYDFSNETVEEIVIDMNAADINITSGNALSVSTTFPEKCQPTVKVEKGKLIIDQTKKVSHVNNLYDDSRVDIVIPKDAVDNIVMDVHAGDIDIQGIKVTVLDMEVNAGDIDINDLSGDSIEIEANAGDINVDANVKAIEVNANAGDIDI